MTRLATEAMPSISWKALRTFGPEEWHRQLFSNGWLLDSGVRDRAAEVLLPRLLSHYAGELITQVQPGRYVRLPNICHRDRGLKPRTG